MPIGPTTYKGLTLPDAIPQGAGGLAIYNNFKFIADSLDDVLSVEATSKTTAYTVTTADNGKLILADATAAAFTITLPNASLAGSGFYVAFKKIDVSANAVTIDGFSSQTIDAAATYSLGAQHDYVVLACDGDEWHVIGNSQSETEIDGDAIDIDYNPTNYTEADSTLAGHLEGIDLELAASVGSLNNANIVVLEDQKTSGTDGQLLTAGDWRTRDITTEVADTGIRNAKVLFGLAVENDRLALNPFDRQVGATPAVDKGWHYLKLDALGTLLDACPTQQWRSLFATLRLAGLRLGEALRMTWLDVDQDRCIITVAHEGEATTKKRRREVPMVPKLQAELAQAYTKAAPGQLGPCPLRYINLHRDAAVILKRAGLEPWSKLFHTLRKNCESDWLAEHPVMAVCEWLGHDPTIAAKHYHQVGADTLAKVTGKLSIENEVDALRRKLAEAEAKIQELQQETSGG
jgi:integrase